MNIAIRGHEFRGKEVIQILKSLGGKHDCLLRGNDKSNYYYIEPNKNKGIRCHDDDYVNSCKKYTLEEFEQEFPFKIGDIILLKGVNKPYEIIALEWYMNKLCYKLDNGLHYAPETLTTYKEMKEERSITLTLDKAKEWYNKGGDLKQVALQAFTEKELNPLPRSWEEFSYKYKICFTRYAMPYKYAALYQLEQLRNCWWNGWKPNWLECNVQKYVIRKWRDKISIETSYVAHSFLSFPTYEMAKEFLECFRDLIEQAGDLI
jgi:hypothetical protein